MMSSATICLLLALSLLCVFGTLAVPESLDESLPASGPCLCGNATLCAPLTTPFADRELFLFSTQGDYWAQYPWDSITTIAMFFDGPQQLICLAHSHNVRVVLHADYPVSQLFNATQRAQWVSEQLQAVALSGADGVNVDFESAIDMGSPEAKWMTELMNETTTAFHKRFPHSQVTFDVAWSPACIDDRCYDYVGIAEVVDFVFVMSYDERSQIYGPCQASPNSALPRTAQGIKDYLALGIPASKMVLGVPWYGYDYPCVSVTDSGACMIKEVPFRGVACSDAGGSQRTFSDLYGQMSTSNISSSWDPQSSSPYYHYVDDAGQTHHVWYDDSESIAAKCTLLSTFGLRGIGMWNSDQLDYTSTDPTTRAVMDKMWDTVNTCK